ncbi:MAG: hypothetical protein KC776_36350 [Myxococcales bacterium]|nr:hypothetical protein [Myxococcales bacterium]MCB9582111.1 hypothetical protein [Polyangiaceae bacterium]
MHVDALKDPDAAHPVPTSWRPTFCAIVDAFVRGDLCLARPIPGVDPIPADRAQQISSNITAYGADLRALPDDAWLTSCAQWTGANWEVLVDLWTAEEGPSDLVLHALVAESADGFRFTVHLVYVP